jgi:hypothetical protein
MPRSSKGSPFNLFPRASGFYALSNCAISFRLSQAAGPEPPTLDSVFGTATHGVLSGAVKADGVEPPVHEMALDLEGQYSAGFNAWVKSLDAPPENRHSERRLYLRSGEFTLASGQPDRFTRAGTNAHLADFKTSWHPIDSVPAENAQLRVYGALVYDFYKHKLDSLTAHIHKPGTRLPPTLFTKRDLVDARSWSIDVAQTALAPAPGAQPRKGPWCRYCAGKILCPLWQSEIKNLTSFAYSEIENLSDQALANLAPRLELAAQIVQRLSQRLYDRVAHAPSRFPGWFIEPGAWKRKITNPTQAYQLLVQADKPTLSHQDFLAACRVSVTALQSILAQTLHSRSAADMTLNSLLAPDGTLSSTQNRPHLAYDPELEQQTRSSSPSFLPELSQTQKPSTQPLLQNSAGQNVPSQP